MAPAEDIPESITIDLTGLDFHDSVHVSALKLPEGCRPLSGTADLTVVTIVPPTVMIEETPAAGAAAAPAIAGAAAAPAAGAAAKADAGKGATAPAKAAAAPAAAKPAAAKPAAKK
jgi:large subunit ribosomal protein L25